MELFLLITIALIVIFYRGYRGKNTMRFINDQVTVLYDKFAPYSYKKVREKTKQLGQEFTSRQYVIQATLIGGFAAVISYLY